MNHTAIVQPGSNMCVCGKPDDHPVHGFVEWEPDEDRLALDRHRALRRELQAQLAQETDAA